MNKAQAVQTDINATKTNNSGKSLGKITKMSKKTKREVGKSKKQDVKVVAGGEETKTRQSLIRTALMCVSHIAFIATKDAFKGALVSALDRKRCSTWTQPKYDAGRKESQVEFDAEIDEIMTIASELSQGRSHDVAPGWNLDQADRFNELADAAFLEKLYEYLKDSRRDALIAAVQAAKEVFRTAIEIAVQGVDDTDQEMLESIIKKAVEGTKPTAYIAAAHVAKAVLDASLDAAVTLANETYDEAVEEAFLEGMGTGCGGW